MKRILIIEDDASFAEGLREQLSAQHEVEICPDGQSGYYAIYEFKPDAVLLDLTIAQMAAVSLVGKIKAQKQFNRLPIYVMADLKTLSLADEALAAGANQAFSKEDADVLFQVASALSQALTASLARKPAAPILAHSAAPAIMAPAPAAFARAVQANAVPASVERSIHHFSAPSDHLGTNRLNANFQQSAALSTAQYFPELEEAGSFLGQEFLDTYGQRAHLIRKEFIAYRTAQPAERKPAFERFLHNIATLNIEAKEAGFTGLSLYLSAIELRVTQLLACLDVITAPSLQILAAALDVLAALDNHSAELRPLNNMTPHALVVDDENVSRRALSLGLEKARIKATSVDNPDAAIHEAEGTPFDIIFLDVELPKMNGFALCARLRLFPTHRKTPILFVTSLSDMKSRASSRVSGGNQFLTKPLNFPELTVNAWTLVIRKRILETDRAAART